MSGCLFCTADDVCNTEEGRMYETWVKYVYNQNLKDWYTITKDNKEN